jgi:thiol-disulfide isomerase/thioredoxin
LALGALSAGLLTASLSLAGQNPEATTGEIPTISDIEMRRVGDAAPLFALDDLDGKPFDLGKEVAAKVHLVVFWSMYCDPCRSEMALIQQVHEAYRDKGLEVVAIALDGESVTRSLREVVRHRGYAFRVFIDLRARDESLVVADAYGVPGTPALYLVGRDGRVSFADLGRTPMAALQEAIEAALGKK